MNAVQKSFQIAFKRTEMGLESIIFIFSGNSVLDFLNESSLTSGGVGHILIQAPNQAILNSLIKTPHRHTGNDTKVLGPNERNDDVTTAPRVFMEFVVDGIILQFDSDLFSEVFDLCVDVREGRGEFNKIYSEKVLYLLVENDECGELHLFRDEDELFGHDFGELERFGQNQMRISVFHLPRTHKSTKISQFISFSPENEEYREGCDRRTVRASDATHNPPASVGLTGNYLIFAHIPNYFHPHICSEHSRSIVGYSHWYRPTLCSTLYNIDGVIYVGEKNSTDFLSIDTRNIYILANKEETLCR